MSKPPWKPWREVVALREDVRSGELSLNIFAADLYDVVMEQGARVYRDPAEFFALTYPTYALRQLARDVVLRLAARTDKAVRQLELTYGGGKTHTLITLFHLANDPEQLPNLPAVDEFRSHIGLPRLPRARVAVLAFDKIDVEKGMEIRGPRGTTRWLRHPWSVLAYQIAGDAGLRLLHPEERAEERDSAPAENLLATLLALPTREEDLATLVLIDEVLMYAREKVAQDPTWRGKLANFFQYLTQAASKVERCAVVASLLATDPARSDMLGREVLLELQTIFLREQEEGVQPVGKDDVAEVLRRRFFTPESIRDREAFRPHVVAALDGITRLDEQTKREASAAEDRYWRSYPFHPDLTDIFYSKWTGLPNFQRTRGILRTFALALREAAQWDQSPLIAANVFLAAPDASTIGEAGRELAAAAVTDEGTGSRQEWSKILEGELAKARELQQDFPNLRHRELEQAVLAVFLHSQPAPQKALTRELLVLLGHTRPDRIELEKVLKRWTEVSWFLDESAVAGEQGSGPGGLPRSWRLGSRPNLRQMHHDARQRVAQLVAPQLLKEIEGCSSLYAGVPAPAVKLHKLPNSPADVPDDGVFRFAVLGPSAVSDSGKPSAEAVRFLTETTGPDRPRVNRNAVLLAVPSREGLELARDAVRSWLGWLEVDTMLKGEEQSGGKHADPLREQLLKTNTEEARKTIPRAVRQAYGIVVAFNEQGEPAAFKLPASTEPLFTQIKADDRARIQETRIDSDALMPGGPYALWRDDDAARWVKDLAGAFAQNPALPRMLDRTAIMDTIAAACQGGTLVLRSARPDRTYRTYWREPVDAAVLEDRQLEAVLPEHATLTGLPPALLAPDALPVLWHGESLPYDALVRYFAGGTVVQVDRGGYEEPFAIPTAGHDVVEEAVRAAIRDGILCLSTSSACFLREEIPAGLLTDDATLAAPPPPINVMDLLPANLPDAWGLPAPTGHSLAETPLAEPTTAHAITEALARKAGKPLPWSVVRAAIAGAIQANYLALTPDSAPWPADAANAATVRLCVPAREQPRAGQPTPPPPPPPPSGAYHARAVLASNEIQNLADAMDELVGASIEHELRFTLEIDVDPPAPPDVVQRLNDLLAGVSPHLVLRRGE